MTTCPHCAAENSADARFCSACGTPLTANAAPVETRKTVTILFMDVVGSTELGEHSDPEPMRRVMTRYFNEIRAVVERHGGVVEKYIGDAVMAVFGVPVVHEDDAARAVRAAVEMRARLAELDRQMQTERGVAIAWRTGINTGEVVAGDAGAGQRFVSGDAVNVAARLEQSAQAGEVLIGAATRRLVRNVVDTEPVAPLVVKGKSQPLEVYRLLGSTDGAGAAAAARRLESPLIGRRRQSRLLGEAYEQVVDERVCHLFTILGAAGVGKSRLVGEFLGSLPQSGRVLRGRCLSYGEGITYWPIAEVIRDAAGLVEGDDDETYRAKIGALIDERDRAKVSARIGELIGRLPADGGGEETFWAVRTVLESIARRTPLVLVLEDIHWAEPTLLDLIEHLADWMHDAPLLLVCVARQSLLEARPGWGGGKSYATTLTLEPLNEAESRELLVNLLGQVDLHGELVEKISTAAGGNPLFVEEMIGMLMDNGALVQRDGMWLPSASLAQLSVPPSIQALLAARLDGLPAAERAVIERGAIEGQVFHRGAVAELAPPSVRSEVPAHLRALARKELVRPDRSDFAGDEAFRFRHLLIRDAAYSSMPKEARADLHARFADWLVRMAGDHVSEYEEILGYHLEQAYRYRAELGPIDDTTRALGEDAARRLRASGRRALERGDVRAAVKLLGAAVDLTPSSDPDRFRLIAELGAALIQSGDVRGADGILEARLEQARHSGTELDVALLEIVLVSTRQTIAGRSIEEAILVAERLLAVFERHGDRWGAERATLELARQHFFAGRSRRAYDTLNRLLAGYAPEAMPNLLLSMLFTSAFWGPIPVDEAMQLGVATQPRSRGVEAAKLRMIGGLLALQGDFENGRQMLHQALAVERELGRRHVIDSVMGHQLGRLELESGDVAEAERVLVEAYDSQTERGDNAFASTTAANLAHTYIAAGQWDKAAQYAELALTLSTEDDVEARAQGKAARARVLAARGDTQAAVEDAHEAVRLAETTDYLDARGLTNADLAEVLLFAGRREESASAMRRAIENMEAKGALAYLARFRRRLAEIEGG